MKQQKLNIEDFYDIKIISQGVFGSIQSAKNLATLDKLFTMKTYDISPSKPELLIKNELKIWERLSSLELKPKAIPCFAGFTKNKLNQYNLIFDVHPQSLKEIIDDLKSKKSSEPFPFDQLKTYFDSLIKSFAFLQTMNICHQDLKPGNLIIDQTVNQIYLLDFTISKENIVKASVDMKKEFSITGSSMYFPPEIDNALNGNSSQFNVFKSDVFSLALIFLELGSLQLPNKIYGIPQWKEGIESALKRFKEVYKDSLQNSREKQNLDDFLKILRSCLNFSPEERTDFNELFLMTLKNIEDDKLRMHILLEEQLLSLENLKNLEKMHGREFSLVGTSKDQKVEVRIWGKALNSIDKENFLDEE